MNYTHAELDQILKDQQNRRRELSLANMRQTKLMGDAVSELQSDPRWEKYCRPIELWLKESKAKVENYKTMLLRSYVPHEEYTKLRISYAEESARMMALEEVVGLAKRLVEDGKLAEMELGKPQG